MVHRGDSQVLDLRRVSQKLGGNQILTDLSISVADGEFTAILGPSGCGKSTTLRIMAGLDRPQSGTVLMDGRDVTDHTPAMRNVAMVFQSYALYPHFSVAQNIALPLVMRECNAIERVPLLGSLMPGMAAKRSAISRRVREIAGLLEIEALLERRPSALSGGQQQRVAVGRALVRDPALFLLDEPLSNLDAKLRIQMRAELSALHRRSGKAFVYVTHDQTEAMTMADRVLMMFDGEVIQDGPPRDLYERPATRDVAAFIGAHPMNLFDLAAPDGDASHLLARLGVAVRDGGSKSEQNRRVTVGIRPEHLRLSDSRVEAVLSGVVERLEYHGRDSMVTLRVDGLHQPLELLNDLQAEAGGGAISPGDRVSLNCRPEDVHVFAAADGRRLAVEFRRSQ